MATFKPTTIHDNPDGWGPPMDLAPAKFQDMPYAPFSKSDRLGRAADWTTYGGRSGREIPVDDQASDFTMVDSKVLPKPSGYSRGRQFRGSFRSGRNSNAGGNNMNNNNFRDGGGNNNLFRNKQGRNFQNNNNQQQSGYNKNRSNNPNQMGYNKSKWEDRRNIQREASVEVGNDWELLEEIPNIVVNKFDQLKNIQGTDLKFCGTLPYFNKQIDKVTVKTPKRLVNQNTKIFYPKITTTSDNIIRKFAGNNEGTIFSTFNILALLMCSQRTIQSWDIVIQKIDNKLFLDKRDNSIIDFITVNETSNDPPKDEKLININDEISLQNCFQKLSIEATNINENFISQCSSRNDYYSYDQSDLPYDKDDLEFKNANQSEANIGYRYRKWDLGDNIVVVARCELDGAYKPYDSAKDEKPVPIVIRTLNEYFDPNLRKSSDWRGKLDTQRSAVLATEVKNNSAKLSRWTAEAIMADADRIKFGFVSRIKATDNENHVILGTQMYRPKDFASQIALNTNKMWGILKGIMQLCFNNLQDGEKAVLLKDPNKPIIRLYKVPDDAFESNEEEDEDDDDVEGQSQLFS